MLTQDDIDHGRAPVSLDSSPLDLRPIFVVVFFFVALVIAVAVL